MTAVLCCNDGNSNNDNNNNDDLWQRRHFCTALNAVLALFAKDRPLLETKGSLIVRRLCVLLGAKDVFVTMAALLNNGSSSSSGLNNSNDDDNNGNNTPFAPNFVSTMVQTLNLILLTAAETHGLRAALRRSFDKDNNKDKDDDRSIFAPLFHCWCHNPVSTLALCLLARAYDLAHALVRRFAELNMQYEEIGLVGSLSQGQQGQQ